ncbi:uncharacterized protein SETTUDRAFT_166864 [Exserohilum turcica Et28A]|uniref:Uncharacterized protein n=1 Tax=Exserohilum turcicum (strain 28A) TaxID=671987 RepID=R0KT77_EXST2|nr:uncharacterized protein SETTUDRAFT_166864 [Exserohilum turcica Et28A]EOA91007.1 hypothetical protein SETTUDRAFT_166864 [Exserohilum turcica Et28A]
MSAPVLRRAPCSVSLLSMSSGFHYATTRGHVDQSRVPAHQCGEMCSADRNIPQDVTRPSLRSAGPDDLPTQC